MPDIPREKLIELIARFGPQLSEDPKRCEGLLRDLCGEHKREIVLLVAAIREGVTTELRGSQGAVPKNVLAERCVQRMHAHLGVTLDLARWSVESWAIALGENTPAQLDPTLVAKPQQPSLVDPKQPTVLPLLIGILLSVLVVVAMLVIVVFLINLSVNDLSLSNRSDPKLQSLGNEALKDGPSVVNGPPTPEIGPTVVDRANVRRESESKPQLTAIRNSIGVELRQLAPGTFTMGEGSEAQSVTLTQAFYIGVYEVTQEQYQKVMGTNPSNFKGDKNPVDSVSWDDAVEFCRRLSEFPAEKAAGRVYRLPTEAEWEYACRAGTTTRYYFGDDHLTLGEYAWFLNNSDGKAHTVGQRKPNAWGLYDMHGNVWEWCADWFGEYPNGGATDPLGSSEGSYRVYRGGCFFDDAAICRAALRSSYTPTYRSISYGFRLALSMLENSNPSVSIAPAVERKSVSIPQLTGIRNSIGIELRQLSPGTFTMGEGSEAHSVTLTQAFYIGVYEVTQEQYQKVMGTNPSHFKGDKNPVDSVSWDDAVEFCRRLSELPAEKAAGRIYRLPTEAEWEYACRAGTTTRYYFGDDHLMLGEYAWFLNNSDGKAHPVGQKKPNSWGLYDMHGNLWEWCADWNGEYPNGAVTDPQGASEGWERVFRGGGWTGNEATCCSAYRFPNVTPARSMNRGFRVALSPKVVS